MNEHINDRILRTKVFLRFVNDSFPEWLEVEANLTSIFLLLLLEFVTIGIWIAVIV